MPNVVGSSARSLRLSKSMVEREHPLRPSMLPAKKLPGGLC
jgi:hypothetical protein